MGKFKEKKKKIPPKVFATILNLIIIIGLVLGGWWFYKKELKNIFLEKGLPTLSEIEKRIIAPEPLTGPQREEKATELKPELVFEWTNFYREENGVEKLQESAKLEKAAKAKLEDMFQKQYFEHIGPDEKNASFWVEEAGYKYIVIGENLALGDYKNEKELVDAWMASVGHRENILKPAFTEIGIAARLGDFQGRKTFLAVEMFGAPASLCKMLNKSLLKEIEDKKTEYEALGETAEEIKKLVRESNALMKEGNEKIKEGNEAEIREEAEKLWEEGKILQEEAQEKYDEAKELQEKLDKAQDLYKEIKTLINKYNEQVKEYNVCLQKYQ